jgi:hypothetical protein
MPSDHGVLATVCVAYSIYVRFFQNSGLDEERFQMRRRCVAEAVVQLLNNNAPVDPRSQRLMTIG